MNLFQKEFTGLLQAAFSKPNNAVLSPDFDWDKAVKVASIHNIAAILYYGALNCGIPQNTDHMQKLFDLTCKSIMISEQQQYEINRIVTEFEKENIEYMPLKGMVLRSIYPKPEMRTMGDADILIKLETYNRTSNIMKNLGFEFKNETDHEFIWKNPFLYLELHKSVMTSYNKDFYKDFGTGWKIAQKNGDGVKYEMSPEDFYIYIFVHFTKHYRISGIGIKHLLDLWVISEAYPKLNKEYISNELKKMHLHEFYLNVLDTINVWFSNGEENEKTELITNVIYESGQYGIASHAVVSRAIRDNSGSITNKKQA